MNMERITTVEIHTGTSHIDRRCGGRNTIQVDAGGIHTFSGVAIEIEFNGEAVGNTRSSARSIGSITQSATGWSNGRRVIALDGKGETIGGVSSAGSNLKSKVRSESLDVGFDLVPGSSGFVASAVREFQGAAVKLGRTEQIHSASRKTAAEIDRAHATKVDGVKATGDGAVAESPTDGNSRKRFCCANGNRADVLVAG